MRIFRSKGVDNEENVYETNISTLCIKYASFPYIIIHKQYKLTSWLAIPFFSKISNAFVVHPQNTPNEGVFFLEALAKIKNSKHVLRGWFFSAVIYLFFLGLPKINFKLRAVIIWRYDVCVNLSFRCGRVS